MMDVPEKLIDWVLGVVISVCGWFVRENAKKMTILENAIAANRQTIYQHREYVLQHSATKEEIRQLHEEFKAANRENSEKLDRIIDQLGRKADRK